MDSKTIIIMRHGKTDKNEGEKRILTDIGIANLKRSILKIKEYINGDVIVLTTDKKRAIQTAHIVAKELKGTIGLFDNRIKGVDSITKLIQQNEIKHIKMATTYLSVKNYSELALESPIELFKRWNKEIKKYRQKTMIIISHEGSLEAYLKESESQIMYKSFKQYFNYSDFAVLKIEKDNI